MPDYLVLEPLAAELAATEREPKHLRSMAEVVEGMRAGRYQGADFSAANAHFHVTIGEASGNILIATVMKAVSRLIFRNSEKYVRTEEVRQLVLRSHLATYQAIADGDPQRARAEVEALLGEQVRFVEASASVDMPPSEAGEATKPAQRPAAASAAVTKHPSSLEAE